MFRSSFIWLSFYDAVEASRRRRVDRFVLSYRHFPMLKKNGCYQDSARAVFPPGVRLLPHEYDQRFFAPPLPFLAPAAPGLPDLPGAALPFLSLPAPVASSALRFSVVLDCRQRTRLHQSKHWDIASEACSIAYLGDPRRHEERVHALLRLLLVRRLRCEIEWRRYEGCEWREGGGRGCPGRSPTLRRSMALPTRSALKPMRSTRNVLSAASLGSSHFNSTWSA
jgi:hypothetical protein